MPKIRAFTPSWLSPSVSDGRGLFSPSTPSSKNPTFGQAAPSPRSSAHGASSRQQPQSVPGPRRTVAQRGTEVFVANGKEIKWANLASMKEAHDSAREALGSTARAKPVYRILKPPVASDIRQLVVSPTSNYMAVLTTHTVHICLLPDPSHLVATDDADVPLKTRYFTLGPTTHVTTRPPVVSALWHPLGVNGSALVTVTRDAVVRVWDVMPLDRWSFNQPSYSIDVKKLADGSWLEQDFGESVTTNTSYSPDLFDMEVAAACFGPRNSGGWSSMTLYLAMLGGDVYALCPLLPKRWAPPPTLIPSLSVAVVSNLAAIEDDEEATPRARQLARQQVDWMTQIDNQEPTLVDATASASYGVEETYEVYTRPSHPSVIPRLQGPFEVDLDLGPGSDDNDDDDESASGELCDIFVIGEKVDLSFLSSDEEDAPQDLASMADQQGLSLPVICLVTTTGRLHICLDVVGVEAQWLPQRSQALKSSLAGRGLNGRSSSAAALADLEQTAARPLLTFQVVDVVRASERRAHGWCTFSPDVTSRYSFFITHPGGITNISLSSWVFRLEQELQESTETGADFRVRQLVTGENTERQRVYTHTRDETLAACTVWLDPELGYFLLSATEHAPVAICFELPEADDAAAALGLGGTADFSSSTAAADGAGFASSLSGDPSSFFRSTARSAAEEAEDKTVLALDFWKARPAFEIPPELLVPSELSQAKSMLFSSRFQMLQHQEVRLSAATLAIFTNAHKLVGKETGRLNQAAAQMFTKLEDLPLHLREQVESACALKRRIDMIAGEDGGSSSGDGGDTTLAADNVRLQQRLQQAQDRHKALAERMERLRRTCNQVSARPLSDKERAWSAEVQALAASLGDGGKGASAAAARGGGGGSKDVGARVQQVQTLWASLAQQAAVLQQHKAAPAAAAADTRPSSSSSSSAASRAPAAAAAATADDEKEGGIRSSTSSLVSVQHGGGSSANGSSSSSTASPLAAAATPTTTTPTTTTTTTTLPLLQKQHQPHQLKIPSDVRRAKMAQVTKLLERETAMVDAITERLVRLGTTGPA